MNQPSLRGHYAGLASRLAAFVLDIVLVSLSFAAAVGFIHMVGPVLGVPAAANFLARLAGIHIGDGTTLSLGGGAIVLYAGIYFVFFWTFLGRTPGKTLIGLRVVTASGRRPGLGRAVLRFLGYILSSLPLYLGYVWIGLSRRRQGWHDLLAGTYVIYDWDARPEEEFLAEAIQQLTPPHGGGATGRGALKDK